MMKFALIAAVEKNNGLGKNNALVWRLSVDMKHFTEVTTTINEQEKYRPNGTFQSPRKMNAVIMGRKTWESIPEKHRPLAKRFNIILTREVGNESARSDDERVMWTNSLESALKTCQNRANIENVFVIGGAMLYAEAIKHPECKTIYLTRIDQSFDCDAFFPTIDETIFKISERSGLKKENGLDFEFLVYQR